MVTRTLIYINSGAIGEFLMTLFFFERVHHVDPSVDCMAVVQKNKNFFDEIIAEFPYVRIVEIHTRTIFRDTYRLWRSIRAPATTITQQTFGRIPFSIKAFARTISWLSHGELVGFDDGVWYNKTLYSRLLSFNHTQQFYVEMLRLAHTIGFSVEDSVPSLPLPFHNNTRFDVVIAPFAANPKRSLPQARWVSIVREIAQELPSASLAILGAPSDTEEAGAIAQAHPSGKIFTNISFLDTISLIKNAGMFVGVDSGLTHLAGVMQKKSVVVENYSNPTWWPTYNNNAVILVEKKNCTCAGDKKGACIEYLNGKPYFRCMLEVTDRAIVDAIKSVLEK